MAKEGCWWPEIIEVEFSERIIKGNHLKSLGEVVVVEPMVSLLVGLYPLVKDNYQLVVLGWGQVSTPPRRSWRVVVGRRNLMCNLNKDLRLFSALGHLN